MAFKLNSPCGCCTPPVISNYFHATVDIHGGFTAVDDRCVAQASQDDPPQIGRVVTTYYWVDWLHKNWDTYSSPKVPNVQLGWGTTRLGTTLQTRAAGSRPLYQPTWQFDYPQTEIYKLRNFELSAPGTMTHPSADAFMITEDGTATTSVPLSIPIWIGRSGFPGFTGMSFANAVIPYGTDPVTGIFRSGWQSRLVYYAHGVKYEPLPAVFTANTGARKMEVTTATTDMGFEAKCQCTYGLAHQTGTGAGLYDPSADYPDNTCFTYDTNYLIYGVDQRHVATIMAAVSPVGSAWQLTLSILSLAGSCSLGQRYWVSNGNFGLNPAMVVSGITLTPTMDISFTPVGFNTTTSVTKSICGGNAEVTVNIDVSATGQVTRCEVVCTPLVTIVTSGPGWYQNFGGL